MHSQYSRKLCATLELEIQYYLYSCKQMYKLLNFFWILRRKSGCYLYPIPHTSVLVYRWMSEWVRDRHSHPSSKCISTLQVSTPLIYVLKIIILSPALQKPFLVKRLWGERSVPGIYLLQTPLVSAKRPGKITEGVKRAEIPSCHSTKSIWYHHFFMLN